MGALSADKVKSLQGAMSGTVSLPGDAGYDTACSIWNGVIDRRPAVVASCATSGDVAADTGQRVVGRNDHGQQI